MLFYLLKEMKL